MRTQLRSRLLGVSSSALLLGALVLVCGVGAPASRAQAAPSCSPTANGDTGSVSRTPASGVQVCTGGDTGIDYEAKGGDLTVNLNADPISGHSVNIDDDGGARNITVNDGLPASGYTAAAIVATSSNNFGVNLQSSGGNIAFTSYAGGPVSYTGPSSAGAAIAGQTSGVGTVTIATYDAATDPAGTGIAGIAARGAVSIFAYGDVSAGEDAIYAETGGDITVVAGSSGAPVAIATSATEIHDAVNAESAGGNVSITTYGTAAGELLGETSGAGNVVITANGAVAASGGNAAIFAASKSGNVTVTTNGNVTDDIVALEGGTGNITVTANGSITESDAFASIYASGSGGNVTVAAKGGLTNGMTAVTSGSGTVAVTVNGSIGNQQAFDAIYAAAAGGDVSVTVGSPSISSPTGTYAVEADASGAGNVAIALGDGVSIDPPTVGVYGHSVGGLATITTGANDSITAADPSGMAAGIVAKSDLTPATRSLTTSVTTGSGDVISVTGDISAGVIGENRGNGLGGVSITTGAANSITVTGDNVGDVVATTISGPYAPGAFEGAGAATVKIGAANTLVVDAGSNPGGIANAGVVAATDGGNVDVEWAGAGGSVSVSAASGVFTTGILARSGPAGGSLSQSNLETLTVVTGQGTAIVSNNGVGILADDGNYGPTSIVSNGPIAATVGAGASFSALTDGFTTYYPAGLVGGGIVALGAGPTAVTSNSSISVTGGDGVDALSLTSVAVVNNAGIVADHSAILAVSLGGVSIGNNATIEGAGTAASPVIAVDAVGATSISNGSGGAIRSTAGLSTDLIVGFAAAPSGFGIFAPGAVTVDNAGIMTGRIDLAAASTASIDNAGTWTTSGVNSLSGGGAITNAGTVVASGTTTFTGLKTFTNTGVIDMHGSDAAAGDVTVIDGAYAGGGKLVIDALLGTVGSGSGSGCGALADCLQVQGSSGLTSVIVHNLAAVSGAGANATGVVIVTGASGAGQFVIDPSSANYDPHTGMIDEGLFGYALGYDAGAGQDRLYGLPDAAAMELPTLVTAVQNLWYDAGPALDQDSAAASAATAGGKDPQMWAQALGGVEHRNVASSYATGGGTYSFDTSHDQDVLGVVGGLEIGTRGLMTPGDAWKAGLMLGYVGSRVSFTDTPTRADLSGALVGAYADYDNKGFVLSAAFKADILQLDYRAGGAAGFEIKPGADAIGGQIDAGQRLVVAKGVYLEPLADLDYVSATIDSASVAAATVHFGDNDSLRGGAGLKLGGDRLYGGGTVIDWSLTGRAWDEFEGRNRAVILSGGPAVGLEDPFNGAYGEADAHLAAHDLGGRWSAFADADLKLKDRFTEATLSLGVALKW